MASPLLSGHLTTGVFRMIFKENLGDCDLLVSTWGRLAKSQITGKGLLASLVQRRGLRAWSRQLTKTRTRKHISAFTLKLFLQTRRAERTGALISLPVPSQDNNELRIFRFFVLIKLWWDDYAVTSLTFTEILSLEKTTRKFTWWRQSCSWVLVRNVFQSVPDTTRSGLKKSGIWDQRDLGSHASCAPGWLMWRAF